MGADGGCGCGCGELIILSDALRVVVVCGRWWRSVVVEWLWCGGAVLCCAVLLCEVVLCVSLCHVSGVEQLYQARRMIGGTATGPDAA